MEPATIAGIIGAVVVLTVVFTTNYWLSMPKLSDVLVFMLSMVTVYGGICLGENLYKWWVS